MFSNKLAPNLTLFGDLYPDFGFAGEFKDFYERASGIIIATTTNGQRPANRLLHDHGFKLVAGKCYWNPGYSREDYSNDHWIHLWYTIKTPVTHLGELRGMRNINCCGADFGKGTRKARWHSDSWGGHDAELKFLKAAVIPAKQPLKEGWKSFLELQDYKLCHNFDLLDAKKCLHKI